SPNSGRPRLQLITADRVETPPWLYSQEGVSIIDGVQVDAFGRPVAYWVKPDDPLFVAPQEKWVALPADRVIHDFQRSRISQYRGLPIIYPVLADMKDLQELQGLEMLAAKDAARKSTAIE